MSSSWSDDLGRLAGPLAVSFGLHLSLGAAFDALPLGVRDAAPGAEQRGASRLQATLRSAEPPTLPAQVAAASALPPPPPPPPVAAPPQAPGMPEAAVAPEYFLARELDAKPVALAPIEPAYPNDAYLRGIDGSVVVRLQLDEDGKVEQAVVVNANPPGYFEEAVRQAFLAARFSPGVRAGRPVRVQMTVEVRYRSPLLDAVPGQPEAAAR